MLQMRRKNLVSKMPEGFEAALVQTEPNRFYFLDFDAGDAGTLLLLPEETIYIIDSRYIEQARAQVKNARVLLEEDALLQIEGLLQEAGVKHLYLENRISVALYNKVRQKCPSVKLDISATLTKEIEALRAIKDEEEVKRMREAQRITDDCFAHILPFIREGVREVDLMLEMEHYMRSHGAEKVAFDTICVAGAKTSFPHGQPGDHKVQKGNFVTLDFGAKFNGYCTDMTRTVAVGEVSEEKRKVYDTVLRAHLAGIAAVRDGAKCSEVDKAAREIINEAGYKGLFGHGLGHGVGIEIHEEPRFSPKSQETAKAGMMMTVEPGCYLPGRFGCRIEDTVHITETGCEPLPKSVKELLVL